MPSEAIVLKRGFAPVVDANTRLLVLGSLPGDASLRVGQYYGHPRNAFWRLVGDVIGRDLPALPYEDRLTALKGAGVGLWDVIAGAERKGSLDTAIRNAEAADLNRLVESLPNLRAIAFNGAAAATRGARVLGPENGGPDRLTLPSSSPALAKPLAWKAEHWAIIAPYLASPPETA